MRAHPSAQPPFDLPHREVWAIDFEFRQSAGGLPDPVCMVARELRSGRTTRWWRDDLRASSRPPFPCDSSALFVAYYSSAEWGCFLALGWSPPVQILDLYAEFRRHTNGYTLPNGRGLLGALASFGLSTMAIAEKEAMRALALRDGEHTVDERRALLDYCESDVTALERLLAAMMPHLDLPRALLRGRYMAAAARIERNGIPVDTATYHRLLAAWPDVREALVRRIDAEFGVFDGTVFRANRFEDLLARRGIPWPRLESGRLALDDGVFREMTKRYPALSPLRDARSVLAQLRSISLEVGPDGRSRTLLSAFASKTGRNQPSNSRFIFGLPAWLRSLIRPERGSGLAYVDFSQQEFAIAGALSGDAAMMAAYSSGDPYLAFAVQAGAAPPAATRATHGAARDVFKTVALAVQYGAGAGLIASRTGLSEAHARELLRHHQRVYRRYWQWIDAVLNHALLRGSLDTVFGWRLHVTPDPRHGIGPNPRSLGNFPIQANGAEILRLACIFATDSGVRVCAPVHDALLVEAPLPDLDAAIAVTRKAMADASRIVLDGFEVRTDVKRFHFPDRYVDDRGAKTWATVQQILEELGR